MMKALGMALAVLLALPLPARADGPVGKTDVFAGEVGFARAAHENVRYDARAGGFRLQDALAGGYVPTGRVTLAELHYGFGFDRVVASWNADCPPGTAVTVELSSSADDGKTWSSWYEAACWGDPAIANARPLASRAKQDTLGKVDQDTLELLHPATLLHCRISLTTTRPEVTPLLTLVAIAAVDHKRTVAPDDTRSAAWGREVPADFRSQGWENADISYRICGPTSTGMMLTSHGVHLPTAKVADACWDETNGIYGNWPFIAAGASALMRRFADDMPSRPGHPKAFQAYVNWAPDWKAVENEILAGNPCVVSIHYNAGELKGAPVDASDGHLILVRGFTPDGNVVVNDPAARTSAHGRVVYDRQQLHAARHGGPIIVFHPYE